MQSRRSIEAWKAYLLRSVNQAEACLDVLNGLKGQEVLVVLDWAMKFLPRKYHESQADWYGKRGISWHISVATRKCKGEIEMLTLIHVFQSCSQDSIAVLAVIEDVIKTTERRNSGHQFNLLQARQRWLLPQRCNHAGFTTTRLPRQCCPENGFFRSTRWERSL